MAALATRGCYGDSEPCPISASASTIVAQPLCFELGNPRAASFLPSLFPALPATLRTYSYFPSNNELSSGTKNSTFHVTFCLGVNRKL